MALTLSQPISAAKVLSWGVNPKDDSTWMINFKSRCKISGHGKKCKEKCLCNKLFAGTLFIFYKYSYDLS